MTKTKKTGIIITAVLLAVCLIVTAVVLLVPKKQDATTVMECSINPKCQFVLDQNNKVMTVNCLNQDAEILLQAEDFEGKTAEEAANLLVKIATESGYIEVNTTGKKVTVTFYTEENKDIHALKDSVVKSMNDYFDENGIIAGAVAEQIDDFEQFLSNLGANVNNYANMTKDEILAYVDKTTKELDGVAVTLQNQVFQKIEEIRKSLDISSLEEQVTQIKATIQGYQDQIDKLKEQYKDMPVVDDRVKPVQDMLDEAQKNLDKVVDLLKNKQAELNKQLDDFVAELRERTKAIYDQAKQELQTRLDTYKSLVAERKAYFEKNAQEIMDQINAYRIGLCQA